MDRVREIWTRITAPIAEWWGKLSRTIHIIILAVAASVVVAGVVLIVIFNQTEYVVLYTGMADTEMSTVYNVLRNELLYTDVKIEGGNLLIKKEDESTARMQLATQGYPKTTFNYNIWDEGIDMFSTESDRALKQIQQLQQLLMSTLDTIPEVDNSKVIISMEEEDPYAIKSGVTTKTKTTVQLKIKNGMFLDSDQIEGVYNLVMTAVPGLERENISIVDGRGAMLLPDDGTSAAEDLAITQERFKMKMQFQKDLAAGLKSDIEAALEDFIREFSVNVWVELDYGDFTKDETIYTPSVPEAGTEGGMVSSVVNQIAYGGITAEGGPVGTFTNADISPDYPTLIAEAGTDMYLEQMNQKDFKVNEVITHYSSTDYMIKNITASVILDGTALSEREALDWRMLIANSIGASVDNISVIAMPRLLNSQSGDITGTVDTALTGRNTLIFIIIALGVVLIILFLLAIMTSGSKKKRQVRSRAFAGGAAPATGAGGIGSEEMFGATSAPTIASDGTDATASVPSGVPSIASLVDDGDTETREGALKREIRDFSAQNPDIVAQLIRTWMTDR